MDAATPIDLKALMVEREDCDAGTVQQLRNGLAQGGNQYRSLRKVAEILKKKLEGATGPVAKVLAPEAGGRQVFSGHLNEAAENLKQAERLLGRVSISVGRSLQARI